MQVMWAIGGNSGCSRSLVSQKAVHAGCHGFGGFGVCDKAVLFRRNIVVRRDSQVDGLATGGWIGDSRYFTSEDTALSRTPKPWHPGIYVFSLDSRCHHQLTTAPVKTL